MIKSGLPNSPGRRLLAIFLLLGVVLLVLGKIYVRATFDSRPDWIELAGPAIWAMIGLAIWLIPEGWPSMSLTWRRRFIAFFFALSAFGLILYFV